MTPYKVLTDLGFGDIIHESTAQTQVGGEVITKYKSYLMTNAESCKVVNQFVREASQHRYDCGVNEALGRVADYIQQNKTSWAIATACESIKSNNSNFNLLNRNAATQAEKLLEQNEENVVKYIRSGALKNVMYCEAFRNIAKQVYAGQPIVEAKAEYKKITPVSMVESVGDGHCFVVARKIYKVDDANNITEASRTEVSNTFLTIENLLESQICSIDEHEIAVNIGNSTYIVSEANNITKKQGEESRSFTTESFREHVRLVLMTANPRRRTEMAAALEGIALVAENYDSIVALDNTSIYETRTDRFLVIESGDSIYASLIASTKHPAWTVNENAVKALSFIKSKTNVELGDEYKTVVENAIESANEEHKAELQAQIAANEDLSIRTRIANLTEKYKDDPVKLSLLANLAAEYSEIMD